ncbi:single-stranded DNA-binding protein [Calothrix sp. UHCC 0171]|uniref:single-stranded DNA-binding protein n=1 Tax=Calothrix sp. UHCC 0171 TaxID=3110245 RepID=UPI002B1F748F|nr:single-stranded DNA-binding protein [Calothrix sp. UHCC 0171]MEA5570953.1 single-stranded DNA-binding protein [Calothrix sp. UHCC 0171]
MNNCILMAEITNPPQLRHTPDGLELAEMMVQFPASRPDDPPGMLRVIGWGNMAKEIHANYHQGDRVLIEGRLGMNKIQREGFKETRAELTVQKIHSLSAAMMTTAATNTPAANYPPTNYPATNTPATNYPPANNAPSYESPVSEPTPTRTNVGVMNNEYTQSVPQRNFEPSTYPAMDAPDEDDIPF